MNASKPTVPDRPSTAASARQLVQFIRASRASVESIATDDHATMDEIEQALATAEAAAQRLLQDIQPATRRTASSIWMSSEPAPRRVSGQARRRSRTLSARARRINVASDEGDQIGGSWRFTESAFRL
ncbi:MAG: hypothetical protein ACK4X1_09490 [Terricaulis sp.]